jgi:hypothetical protein
MTSLVVNQQTGNTVSQRSWALAQLAGGRALTAEAATFEIGCTRLASRIDELRTAGHAISTTMIPVRNRFGKTVRVAEYRMGEVA